MQKKVLALHDLSGFGRSSLVPIIAADGGTISLHERIAQYYPGTGDLFAAVVLGALLNGRALADACALAGEFVKDCIAYTAAQHTDPMHGVQFEKMLPRLFSCHENQTEV